MMASILKLRIINLIGASIFCIYGLLIESYPVAVMNFLIALSNIYYLLKYRNIKEEFSIMEASPNSTFLGRFLELNYNEIKKYFPNFVFDNTIHNVSFYILRNMNVAGIFIATHYSSDTLKIVLDYVTKGYRNLLCETNNPAHIKYLEKMGYQKTTVNNQTVYIKTLQ